MELLWYRKVTAMEAMQNLDYCKKIWSREGSLIRHYHTVWNIDDTATEYGVSRETVMAVLAEYGYTATTTEKADVDKVAEGYGVSHDDVVTALLKSGFSGTDERNAALGGHVKTTCGKKRLLRNLNFSNTYSFRDRVEFDLTDDDSIAPVAALYGYTASGKTNFVRVLKDVVQDVCGVTNLGSDFASAYESRVCKMGKGMKIAYSITVTLAEAEYTYAYAICEGGALCESLHRVGHGKNVMLYEREAGICKAGCDPSLALWIDMLQKNRPNMLWLPLLTQIPSIGLSDLGEWFRNTNRWLKYFDLPENVILNQLAYSLHKDIALMEAFRNLIRVVDPSVSDIKMVSSKCCIGSTLDIHRVEGEEFVTPLSDESVGIKKLARLFLPIAVALREGQTVVIDDLCSGIPEHLVAQLTGLFSSGSFNPDAQLIFTAYDIISTCYTGQPVHGYFVDKDKSPETSITRLNWLVEFNKRLEDLAHTDFHHAFEVVKKR